MRKINNPLLFIFITVLMDCIGLRIIFPVVASLVAEVSRVDVNEAVTYSGWMMVSYALMQFFFSPVLGGLSDRFGRRPVLLLSLLGTGMNYLFLAFANTLSQLFLGRIIAGICGASLTTGFAYVADISPPEKRAQNFGIIGAAVGLGFIIGPFIGGLLSEFGTRVPFIAAAGLSLLNGCYGFFILPESLGPEARRKFNLASANPFGAMLQWRKHKSVQMLLVVLFLLYLAGQVMPAIWPFYTKFVYNWSDLQIGYSLAFMGVMVALVKGGLVKWMQERSGPVRSVYGGILFTVAGLALFAFANHSWMLYVFILVYCLGGIASPSLQGIISVKLPANEQGELQGIITSLMSVSNIISPIIMTHLFFFFTRGNAPVYFPGAPFAAAALFVFVGLLISLQEFRNLRGSKN